MVSFQPASKWLQNALLEPRIFLRKKKRERCARCMMSTWTFISLSVSQILMTRTSPDVMRRPVSCSQSTTIPAPTTRDDTAVTIHSRHTKKTCTNISTHTHPQNIHQHGLLLTDSHIRADATSLT